MQHPVTPLGIAGYCCSPPVPPQGPQPAGTKSLCSSVQRLEPPGQLGGHSLEHGICK